MDASEDYGSVTAGKMADLVLLEADPLQDIRNTRKISAVIFGGKVFGREALDGIFQTAIDEASLYATSPEPQ
jgi:imidazolonepropionase-like amidohydrolase